MSNIEYIKDIAYKIGSGLTPLRSNIEFWDKPKYAWLKTEQLGEFQIHDTYEYISEKAYIKTSIRLWAPNTISVAMYGEGQTRGKVSILKNTMTTNQACCNIIVNDKLADYRYVYYWLKNNYTQLRNLSSGVRKNLNSDDIKNFIIKYIPKTEQTKIATILYTLDSKIELNNKINKELENSAQTLYNYWFMQFDFPDENGKPYKSSGGEMVWNKELKREIPKDWGVKTLDSLGHVITGKTPSTANKDFYGKDTPFITIPDMNNNIFVIKTNQYLSKLGSDSQISKVLPQGTIITSCIATVGLVSITAFDSQINQQINALIPHSRKDLYFLYNSIKNIKNLLINLGKGGTTTLNITILYPHKNIVEKYNNIVTCMYEQIENQQKENKELSKLRDFLLPMLMNGQAWVE